MRPLAVRVGVLCLLCLPAGAGIRGQSADRIRQVEQGLRPPIQIANRPVWTLQERMTRLHVPGLGIAIVGNLEVEWARGYGVRDARAGGAVTAATRFQWASITKPVTAVVALRLVENGVLDLDRDVNDVLKSWKVPENEHTRNARVTLRRLLSHDAGVTVSGFRGYAQDEPVPTILQSLDGLAPASNVPIRVDKTPGTGFRYSGGGYTIVQQLVEDVTGRSLAQLARELVFDPAGMTGASIGPPASGPGAEPLSMAHVKDEVAVPGYRFLVGGSGCCGLWATPSDVARFVIAIHRAHRGEPGAILSKTMVTTMLTPVSSPVMGLGLNVIRGGGGTYFAHSGGNPGFSSLMVGNLETGDGFAVAVNSNGNIAGEIQNSIARAYGWQGVPTLSFASAEDFDRRVRQMKKERPDELVVRNTLSEGNLTRLGRALLEEGDTAVAVVVFRTTADVFPESAGACVGLAEAYESSGDAKAALEQYRLAIGRLDRFPASNRSDESSRVFTQERIRQLEAKLKGMPGRP